MCPGSIICEYCKSLKLIVLEITRGHCVCIAHRRPENVEEINLLEETMWSLGWPQEFYLNKIVSPCPKNTLPDRYHCIHYSSLFEEDFFNNYALWRPCKINGLRNRDMCNPRVSFIWKNNSITNVFQCGLVVLSENIFLCYLYQQ